MKRPLENENEDIDPITMEPFSSVNENSLVCLEGKPFYLPSIFHWTLNLGKTINPCTGLDFGDDSLEIIKSKAHEFFPLEVNIKSLSGPTVTFKTTTLISWHKLIFYALKALGQENEDTLGAVLKRFDNSGLNFVMKGKTILSLMCKNPYRQLNEVEMEPTLNMFKVYIMNPPEALNKSREITEILRKAELPHHYVSSRIPFLENVIAENNAL